LREEHPVAGPAGVVTAERKLRVGGHKIGLAAKDDPADDRRGLGGQPVETRAQVGRDRRCRGCLEVEQVPQVRAGGPEHCLRVGVVVSTGEVGGDRPEILEQGRVDCVCAGHAVGVEQDRGGQRQHRLVEFGPPHVLAAHHSIGVVVVGWQDREDDHPTQRCC